MNPARIMSLRAARAGLLLVTLTQVTLSAETLAAPPAALPPGPTDATHILFMGVDVAVQHDDQLLPVRDVEGGALVVKIKGKDVIIPTKGKPVNMKVGRSLKVSTESADIDKLVCDRIYTPANNPHQKFANASGASSGAEAVASLAQGQLSDWYTAYAYASMSVSAGTGGRVGGGLGDDAYPSMPVDTRGAGGAAEAQAKAAANIQSTMTQLNSTHAEADSSANSMSTQVGKLYEDLSEEGFDAIQVSFAVSSPRPLDDPYVVVLAQLRAGEEKKARQYNWVYAQSIERLGTKPVKVLIMQGGLPRGYVIEKFQVHLFNTGQEVATNVAPMRVELTKDEAFEYAVIDYIGSHKNATLPAGLATGQNTEALRSRLADAYRGGPIFVEVAKNGKVGRAFGDRDCTKPLNDEQLDAILRDVRFNPALSQGKAVDGVAAVKASPESP